MHRFSLSPACPGRLYLQHHGGVYRSDDGGETWITTETGLPSNFGFPVLAHPRKPDVAYVNVLAEDGRWAPDGHMAVWKTSNAGGSWEPMRQGLPQDHAFLTVLREGMAHDGGDPLGVYFGTRQGQVYATANEGESWNCIAENLPAVLGVAAVVVD